MIFETHAHYDDEQFDIDREDLLLSMEAGGVGTIVNVSASYESCEKVVKLAEKYPFVYAAVGVHPDEVGALNEETFARMKELFSNPRVVAVGEIGLDYYWDNESHDLQKEWFVRQLNLARELDLPVLIHSRDAAADTDGDYEAVRTGTGRCNSLFFLFRRDGRGIREDGILYRHRRRGDI